MNNLREVLREFEAIVNERYKVEAKEKRLLRRMIAINEAYPTSHELSITVQVLAGASQRAMAKKYRHSQGTISRIISKCAPHLYEKLKAQDRAAKIFNYSNFDNYQDKRVDNNE